MAPARRLLTIPVIAMLTPFRSCALLATAAALLAACAPATGDAAAADTAAGVAAAAALSEYSLYDLPSAWRDQRGDTLHLADLAGRVRVVAMVYTSCTTTCPLIVADLKKIEAALPAGRRGDVGFVLVSIDPERDTPGRLAEWAAQARLDPARWTLLAGDDDAVRELAASIDVRYLAQPDGELAHTNGLTVLDRTGAVAHRQTGLGDTGPTIAAVLALR
jgi:protein SCO1/2